MATDIRFGWKRHGGAAVAGTSTIELIPLVAAKRLELRGGSIYIYGAGQFRLVDTDDAAISEIYELPSGVLLAKWKIEEKFDYQSPLGKAVRLSRSAPVAIRWELLYQET